MFLNNRHTVIYLSIVTRAQSEQRKKRGSVYYESHHIIPKSLGGSNDSSNLVLLTAREHYLCHRLLTRMTTGKAKAQMCAAFKFMVFGPNTRQKRYPTAAQYRAARVASRSARDPSWVAKMAASLTGRTLTEEHKTNISKNHARSAAKQYELIDATGVRTVIHNLRSWCAEHDVPYQNAYLSAKKNRALRDGRLFVRLST
jgi:hypothetical protein